MIFMGTLSLKVRDMITIGGDVLQTYTAQQQQQQHVCIHCTCLHVRIVVRGCINVDPTVDWISEKIAKIDNMCKLSAV